MNHQPAPPEAIRRRLTIDCVAVTVEAPVQVVCDRLAREMRCEVHPARPLPGRGYTSAAELLNPNTQARRAHVAFDAVRHPWVFAEGIQTYDSPATFEALRKLFPTKCLPTRIDPALDFYGPSTFDDYAAKLLAIAVRRKMDIDQRGDWHRGIERTLYVGSRNSPFYIRLYEHRAFHGYGPEVRLEVEIKLKKRHLREKIWTLDPWFMLITSPVLREFLPQIGMNLKDVPFFEGPTPPRTIDRDLAYIAAQAWPALCRLAVHFGSHAAAMDEVEKYRLETEKARAMLAERVTS